MRLETYRVTEGLTYLALAERLGLCGAAGAMRVFRYCHQLNTPKPPMARHIVARTQGAVRLEDIIGKAQEKGPRTALKKYSAT